MDVEEMRAQVVHWAEVCCCLVHLACSRRLSCPLAFALAPGAAPALQAALAHPAARAAAGGGRRCWHGRGTSSLHLNCRTAQVCTFGALPSAGSRLCTAAHELSLLQTSRQVAVQLCGFGARALKQAPKHPLPALAVATASQRLWLRRCTLQVPRQSTRLPRRLELAALHPSLGVFHAQ